LANRTLATESARPADAEAAPGRLDKTAVCGKAGLLRQTENRCGERCLGNLVSGRLSDLGRRSLAVPGWGSYGHGMGGRAPRPETGSEVVDWKVRCVACHSGSGHQLDHQRVWTEGCERVG